MNPYALYPLCTERGQGTPGSSWDGTEACPMCGGCRELRSLSPVQAVCVLTAAGQVIQRWEDLGHRRRAFYHCSSELGGASARGTVSGRPGLLGPKWVPFREPDKLRGSLPGVRVGLIRSSPSSRSLVSRPVIWFPHPSIFVPSSQNERRRDLGPQIREE